MHSRNKKAMEFIAKGWNALQEVDRVIDYCELNDKRLIPPLRVCLVENNMIQLIFFIYGSFNGNSCVSVCEFNLCQ